MIAAPVALFARVLLALASPLLAVGVGALTMGKDRARQLWRSQRRAGATVLAVFAAATGGLLGFDALDPRMVGPLIATHDGARTTSALLLAVLAALPMVRMARRAGDVVDPDARGSLIALGVSAVVVVATLAFGRNATSLSGTPYDPTVLRGAALRAMVVPSDATAHLSLAYRFAVADQLDAARSELVLARELGASPAVAMEVEAELMARMGDCQAAEQLFRFSLEARVPTDLLSGRLDLRGFHLPPTLVSRCGYGTRTPPR